MYEEKKIHDTFEDETNGGQCISSVIKATQQRIWDRANLLHENKYNAMQKKWTFLQCSVDRKQTLISKSKTIS